jgi:hypothetical protein
MPDRARSSQPKSANRLMRNAPVGIHSDEPDSAGIDHKKTWSALTYESMLDTRRSALIHPHQRKPQANFVE